MQGDFGHLYPEKFENRSMRCATTSTSNGLINLDLDEEWLTYEKLTEVVFFHPEKSLPVPRPRARCIEHPKSADLLQRRREKLIKHKSNVFKNETKCTEIIFDKRADGDKAIDIAPLPIRNSLFPNVPPYILFNRHDCAPSKKLPQDFTRLLKWKFTIHMPRILIKILVNSGYQVVNKGHDWSGIWNLSIRDMTRYQRMRTFQKVNTY